MALATLLSALNDNSITLNYSEVSVHVTSLKRRVIFFVLLLNISLAKVRLDLTGELKAGRNKIYLPVKC